MTRPIPLHRHLTHRLVRLLIALASTALVALHVWVLWRRVADGALFESQVLLRWLGAALLGAAAICLHRQGVSILRGRPAAIFWLAVLVLHAGGPAPVTDIGALAHQLPPELIVLFTLPVGLRWLGTQLGVRDLARRLSRALRTDRPPRLRPLLVSHYPPAARRPPPF